MYLDHHKNIIPSTQLASMIRAMWTFELSMTYIVILTFTHALYQQGIAVQADNAILRTRLHAERGIHLVYIFSLMGAFGAQQQIDR